VVTTSTGGSAGLWAVEADNVAGSPIRAPTVTKTNDVNTSSSTQRADTRRMPAFQSGDKQVAVVDMFQRDNWAILADLAAPTGWLPLPLPLPLPVHAALNGLRKHGMVIARAKVVGEPRYTIVEGVV
jgi:hypothetical protein